MGWGLRFFFSELFRALYYQEPGRTDHVIQNWMRNRNTIEFLGIWEQLNNPDFKPLEFEGFRKRSGLNSFVLTPKQWIEQMGAVGILSKRGRSVGLSCQFRESQCHVDSR